MHATGSSGHFPHLDTGSRLQMRFVSPEGRGEVVWVEEQKPGEYRILNVPVWIYGISVGTLVHGHASPRGLLEPSDVKTPSPGATVRLVVPRGAQASDVYLQRIVPDARKMGIGIGPATFFDPRLVAIHVHFRDRLWPDFASYLADLVEEGLLQEWEVGDPSEDQASAQVRREAPVGDDLVHPLPVP